MGLPIRVDVVHDINSVLPEYNSRDFNPWVFSQPISEKDSKLLLNTLRYNTWFTKFSSEAYKDLHKDIPALGNSISLTSLALRGAGLTSSEVTALADAIKSTKSVLKEIDLSSNSIENSGGAALASALGHLSEGLTVVNFKDCELGKSASDLIDAIAKNGATSLREVNLSNNKIASYAPSAIESLIKKAGGLTKLELSAIGASKKETKVIASALASVASKSQLTHVDLSNNEFDDGAISELGNFLFASNTLQELKLSGSKLASRNVSALLQKISENRYVKVRIRDVLSSISSSSFSFPSLFLFFFVLLILFSSQGVSVDLSDCSLNDSSFMSTAKDWTNIVGLNLSRNDFSDDVIADITGYLLVNKSVASLSLEDVFGKATKNRFSAVHGLAKLVEKGAPLTSLNLKSTSKSGAIGNDIAPLIEALETNKSIQHLDISGQDIGNNGAVGLGKVLRTNATLTSLAFDDNGIGIAGYNAFKQALVEVNRTLYKLQVPHNDISNLLKSNTDAPAAIKLWNEIVAVTARNGTLASSGSELVVLRDQIKKLEVEKETAKAIAGTALTLEKQLEEVKKTLTETEEKWKEKESHFKKKLEKLKKLKKKWKDAGGSDSDSSSDSDSDSDGGGHKDKSKSKEKKKEKKEDGSKEGGKKKCARCHKLCDCPCCHDLNLGGLPSIKGELPDVNIKVKAPKIKGPGLGALKKKINASVGDIKASAQANLKSVSANIDAKMAPLKDIKIEAPKFKAPKLNLKANLEAKLNAQFQAKIGKFLPPCLPPLFPLPSLKLDCKLLYMFVTKHSVLTCW